MSVYSPILGNLWKTLESYGVNPCLAIDKGVYRPGMASSSAARISFTQYDAALSKAAELVNDPAIGLRSAQYLHPTHLGALGHAWLASSTLRTALRRAERYSRMFNEQVETHVQELPDRVRVTYRMLIQPAQPDLVGDGQLAGLLMLCRLNFGSNLEPVEVKLMRTEPVDPTPWFECFGINTQFGMTENSLAISASDADCPLTGSNSELVALNEDVIQRHLMTLDRNNILNQARMRIMEHLPSGGITEVSVARILNMSKRTLHRKLRQNDQTFRSLLMQVRMNLAERYIHNHEYSITEIAFLLGYTDTSAFSRAFKGWFGCSPTQAREQHKVA